MTILYVLLVSGQKTIASVSLLLLVFAVVYPQKRRLTQSEAVALAEGFIAQNGYTDLPPDKTKLSYESIESDSNIDRILHDRHNTLERRAYGVRRGRKGGAAGWTVVFRYTDPVDRQARSTGRPVTMKLDGTGLQIEHVDFILRKAKRL